MLYMLLLSAQYKKDQEILNVGFNQMFNLVHVLVMGHVDYGCQVNNKYSAVLSHHTCTVSVALVTNRCQD